MNTTIEFTHEGWITKTGKFLPCDREWSHGIVAMLELDCPEAELKAERMGWLRLSDYGARCVGRLSLKQRETLLDYCQSLDLDYRETLADIDFLVWHNAGR